MKVMNRVIQSRVQNSKITGKDFRTDDWRLD